MYIVIRKSTTGRKPGSFIDKILTWSWTGSELAVVEKKGVHEVGINDSTALAVTKTGRIRGVLAVIGPVPVLESVVGA